MSQIESVRATCPGSCYMFKIQSFSLLSEFVQKPKDVECLFDVECFESPDFEYSGHKWKLSVYPNGNKKLGVEDHISLYLVSEDADIDSVESEIIVFFKMSIYDHIRDNFLTVGDNEVRRFHSLKKEWGFSRLISIERFKDAKNGYLVNDCCLFGVQIFVLTSGIRSGNLIMMEQPSGGIFTWKLENFCFLSGNHSKEFEVQGCRWKLEIYVNGTSSGRGTNLSMFLLPSGSHKLYVRYVLRVRDPVKGKLFEKTFSHCFAEPSPDWGIKQFISLSDLKEKTGRGIRLNDSLIVEVEVNFISKTTASC